MKTLPPNGLYKFSWDWALYKAIRNDGFLPISAEWDNDGYKFLLANNGYTYYVKIGDWGNVQRTLTDPDSIIVHDLINNDTKHSYLKYDSRPLSQVTHIAIHHSGTAVSASDPSGEKYVVAVGNWHVNHNDWPNDGYHIQIAPDGTIYQTNKLETMSWNVGGQNHYLVGVMLMGDFTHSHPTDAQIESARYICHTWIPEKLGRDLIIKGHREFPNQGTSCPGETYKEWLWKITKKNLDVKITSSVEDTVIVEPKNVKHDIASYFVGKPEYQWINRTFTEANGHESNERYRHWVHDGTVMIQKNGLFEQWIVDGDYIRLWRDVSPDVGSARIPRWYEVTDYNGKDGGAWCLSEMEVGETFIEAKSIGGHKVQFYRKDGCTPLPENSGTNANLTTLYKYHKEYTFNRYGQNITLSNVIEIGRSDGEYHYFAKDDKRGVIGRVGWVSHWGYSEVTEIIPVNSQEPYEIESYCLDF